VPAPRGAHDTPALFGRRSLETTRAEDPDAEAIAAAAAAAEAEQVCLIYHLLNCLFFVILTAEAEQAAAPGDGEADDLGPTGKGFVGVMAKPLDGNFEPKIDFRCTITSSGKNFSFADDCIYIKNELRDEQGIRGLWVGDIVPPPSRTKWTRRVPQPVLIGHVTSGGRHRRRRHRVQPAAQELGPPPPSPVQSGHVSSIPPY
jgi:hypothetical protein